MIDQKDILNIVIGSIIGTITSIVISWYFYKKSNFGAQVAGEMTENLLAFFIQTKLGVDFTHKESPRKDMLPKDKDVPHILDIWHTNRTPAVGERVVVLLRVVDTGMNFGGDEFIEAVDTSTKIGFPVLRQAHAYYSCNVQFPTGSLTGVHTVEFQLTDSKKKRWSYELKFDVRGS